MNKKIIALIVFIILFAIIGTAFYFFSQNSNESQNAYNTNKTEQNMLAENENNSVTSKQNNTTTGKKH